LIGTIYVEPLASHAPTKEDIHFLEQEQRSKELEATFNFLRRTTIITTLAPQIIIISN
jgi:hypothetical protein